MVQQPVGLPLGRRLRRAAPLQQEVQSLPGPRVTVAVAVGPAAKNRLLERRNSSACEPGLENTAPP